MELQRFFVCRHIFHALGDIEDDACEATAIKVNFLMVRNLADGAL